ncbi:hypothetical protein KFE25_014161 [Diacronema lutheri]|uniref:Uncharacterized protein n=1 Tax=Diacronema lutheri TaxID=2081491 RepID=A0A8J5X6B1_DIALT|nr:hypothetical protein KFE25_014161 [Diacronema lutheri]
MATFEVWTTPIGRTSVDEEAEVSRFLARQAAYDEDIEAARAAGREQALEANALARAQADARAAALADARHRDALGALLDARDELLVAERDLDGCAHDVHDALADAWREADAARALARRDEPPLPGRARGRAADRGVASASALAASAMAHLGAVPSLRAPLNAFVAATLGASPASVAVAYGTDRALEPTGADAARARVEGAFDELMAAVRALADAGAAAHALGAESAGVRVTGGAARATWPARAGAGGARVDGAGAGSAAVTPSAHEGRRALADEARGARSRLDARHVALAARLGSARRATAAFAAWRARAFVPTARARLRDGARVLFRRAALARAWRALGGALDACRRARVRRGWRALLDAAGVASAARRTRRGARARPCDVLERVRDKLSRALAE